jgi:hypothetical protein
MKKQLINKRGEVVYLDDDSNIVPDGYGIRFPIHRQDSVQQAIATNTGSQLTDAWGGFAGFRPGYVFGPHSEVHVQTIAKAREAYKARISDAWKTPIPVPSAATPTPVPTQHTRDADASYEARKAKLANAWRTARGVAFGGGSAISRTKSNAWDRSFALLRARARGQRRRRALRPKLEGEPAVGENLRHHRSAANCTRRVRQSLQRNLARRPARISYPSPRASRSMPA